LKLQALAYLSLAGVLLSVGLALLA